VKKKSNISDAEKKVSDFYNTVGWEKKFGVTEDAMQWEDMRYCSKEYVSNCRKRLLKHIPEAGINFLDMASGPIQYSEYVDYSKGFIKRYCVDLSSKALEDAKSKIGEHGVFLHGSFLKINLEENFFDCTVSLHTIYHMDKDEQEKAVRKLLFVTKTGKPVIIVYSNPSNIISKILSTMRQFTRREVKADEKKLYFYQHHNIWWEKFSDVAKVEMLPWRSLSSRVQTKLIPNNRVGRKMLSALFYLEDRFPNFFVKHFSYSMIILHKY
jgi:ubiquinone/menaquinone biosynthesis C-methylase UbiE